MLLSVLGAAGSLSLLYLAVKSLVLKSALSCSDCASEAPDVQTGWHRLVLLAMLIQAALVLVCCVGEASPWEVLLHMWAQPK